MSNSLSMFCLSIPLGFDSAFQSSFLRLAGPSSRPARVAGRERGAVGLLFEAAGAPAWTSTFRAGEGAQGLDDLAVGDWVSARPEADTWIIEARLPRSGAFVRKSAGRSSLPQVVAANVDRAFIVTSVGRDLNPRRIERYLVTAREARAEPLVVINKADLPHDPGALLRTVERAAPGVAVALVSALSAEGLGALEPYLRAGETLAFVGSSGVGKSSLINRLLGRARQSTFEVRAADQRGRHTTTRRELLVSPQGVLLIDTPGMRELGLWDADEGLDLTFPEVVAYERHCRYRDCQHDDEPGCAIRDAVAAGLLAEPRVEAFLALRIEAQRSEQRAEAKRRGDSKKRWKQIHKSARSMRKLHGRLGMKDS